MFSPSQISCINASEKCESVALDIIQIKPTGPTGSFQSVQFPQSSGSGPDLGWEYTQQVLRNTFAGTAGGTNIITSGIFNCDFQPE